MHLNFVFNKKIKMSELILNKVAESSLIEIDLVSIVVQLTAVNLLISNWYNYISGN